MYTFYKFGHRMYTIYDFLHSIQHIYIYIVFFCSHETGHKCWKSLTRTLHKKKHIYTLRMEQPLMMVLTLNCKYYKNITYCTATEIYGSLYKYLKLMHNYKLSASNETLLFCCRPYIYILVLPCGYIYSSCYVWKTVRDYVVQLFYDTNTQIKKMKTSNFLSQLQ